MATEQTATTILLPDILITGTCDHDNGLAVRLDWCGEWHDCPVCGYSHLVPSDALLAQLREQADGLERYRMIARHEAYLDALDARADAEG